jgi:hypothetical protein
MELYSKANREYRKSISWSCRKRFRNGFITTLPKPTRILPTFTNVLPFNKLFRNVLPFNKQKKIKHEVELKDVPGGKTRDRVLWLSFDRDLPQPQLVDRMLRESLEQAVAADGSRNILAMASQGDDVLSDTQYSGELMYRAAERKIMTLEEARGVKTTITDAAGYSVKVSEEKTLEGIKPERKWLTISLIYPTPPPLEQAYASMQSEIEKNVPRGMDINAYVTIGDKGVKWSQRQMDDPTGGYVFMKYDALSRKLYRQKMLIKTVN